MKHSIDPLVDCVFKALLGSPGNKNLLVHFLNAVMDPEDPIIDVELLNPFNERRYEGDKLTVVDVKARTEGGALCQVEVQRRRESHLPQRIRYTWSELTLESLIKGQDFEEMLPAVSIWVMEGGFGDVLGTYHHRAYLNDPVTGLKIDEESAVHILELPQVPLGDKVFDDLHRWLRFFKEAPNLDDKNLPPYMQTQEMQQAMATLKTFTEEDRQRHIYQRRQLYERIQLTNRNEKARLEKGLKETQASLDKALALNAALEAERATMEAERATMEAELAEVRGEMEQLGAENRRLGEAVGQAESLLKAMEKRLEVLERSGGQGKG